VFGVSFVSRLLINEQVWFRLFGGLIFIFIGLKILSANQTHQARSTGKSLIGAYLSAFLLTLTNPATILVFAAIFAAMGIVCSHGDLILEGELIAGIFFGSSLWWLIVGSGIHLFQVRLNPVWLNRTKKIFGAILMGLGILMFFSLAK
jgi:threonine/homoserine/homoserine lactone efflux protein